MAIFVFDEVYVNAPSLFDIGVVIIFTGVSSYAIDAGTANVAAGRLLVPPPTAIVKL